ncbi:DUF1641 domain-containing protein [Metallosphaera javensis (ex Sakai et al. 2022)]|uniref:DUF1641 domain-containing protein n=1 Tax=Metallosphaera javensis (ex Sakai et al. 2022) TaxID=2775498 RepID=UPI00258C6732|nr:MAG: hypothetical protein MjAS7_2388 [Metallosphaera javensis (ex Sakai et al. 2022)]
MDERGVQALDRVMAQLQESGEALEQFLRLVNALNRSGILPFLTGLAENLDVTISSLTEQNTGLIRTLNVIYAVLNGDEEVEDVPLTKILQEFNDPDVRRGLLLLLKILRAIGSASKQG